LPTPFTLGGRYRGTRDSLSPGRQLPPPGPVSRARLPAVAGAGWWQLPRRPAALPVVIEKTY
jgi:hypothetical protein